MTHNENPPRGHFIVLEGADGSGKTTQAALLARALGAVLTRESGGTDLGRAIRPLYLGEFDPTPVTEALLIGADRAQHIDEVVRPALERGQNVVSDRHVASTIAYQGAGRGVDRSLLDTINNVATRGIKPDLVIVVVVSDAVSTRRVSDRGGLDRIEQQDDEFRRRVAQSYLDQASSDPTMKIVSGDGSIEEVASRIYDVVSTYLARSA